MPPIVDKKWVDFQKFSAFSHVFASFYSLDVIVCWFQRANCDFVCDLCNILTVLAGRMKAVEHGKSRFSDFLGRKGGRWHMVSLDFLSSTRDIER